MADDPSDILTYYLQIDSSRIQDIAPLRNSPQLMAAVEKDQIWVSNLSKNQVESIEVKSLPFKRIYSCTSGKLYPLGSLLPERNLPVLNWQPITRVLRINSPAFNHNFFGIEERIQMSLVSTEESQEATMMRTNVAVASDYIQVAPEIRLRGISWILLNEEEVLLSGTPMLPIPGEVFWRNQDHLIPCGYTFELPVLSGALGRFLNPSNQDWIIWNKDTSYFKVAKSAFHPLTIGSFRKTLITIDSDTSPGA